MDRCCWPTVYRGRSTDDVWQKCCSEKPQTRCRELLPKGRSLRSCCGESSPVAAFERFKRANRAMRDSFLESAVLAISRAVDGLYTAHGVAMTGGEENLPIMGFAPRSIADSNVRSISLPDIELFVQLHGKVFDGGRTSFLGWPIFILGNGFGFSTFALAP